MITKSFYRKVILDYRTLISEETYDELNQHLADQVQTFVVNQKISSVHAFLPIERNREPNIQGLFTEFWDEGIKIVVSKTDFQAKTMSHHYLEKNTSLESNHLGIPEPVGNLKAAFLTEIDLIFIPLLLADKTGNRIGYGGGFYDRLLQETNLVKVGLSLSPPVDAIGQREDWDIPLDYLITPFKTYNYG
ncbi:MAG: 5-formyltetrahydrofolate cyclo-ligase [Ekhidna sp.]|nr:5-formyltetrahydrofolate cyclo-ligase [Ekhidna sp.]